MNLSHSELPDFLMPIILLLSSCSEFISSIKDILTKSKYPLVQPSKFLSPVTQHSHQHREHLFKMYYFHASNTMCVPDISKFDTKKVCFNENVAVQYVSSHYEYTPNEFLSTWYTDSDYVRFQRAEHRKFQGHSITLKAEKLQRKQCVEDVRYLVLSAQQKQRYLVTVDGNIDHHLFQNQIKEKYQDLYTTWLAELYRDHSAQCSIAARLRGIELNLSLLFTMLEEDSPTLSKDPSTLKSIAIANIINISSRVSCNEINPTKRKSEQAQRSRKLRKVSRVTSYGMNNLNVPNNLFSLTSA